MSVSSPVSACPACKSVPRHVVEWQFSGLGKSVFDYTAHYCFCDTCGLAYISNVNDVELSGFYEEECAYFSSDHFDVNSAENITKYRAYRKTLEANGLGGKSILDVGCGRGGFLRWLKQNTWTGKCVGIDADVRSMPDGSAEAVTFKRGLAFGLPVEDGSQEVITYFHVLEHIRNLDQALHETSRALQPDGHVLIEVPDAENYPTQPIGTAFWIGIREHVNHFSPLSLAHALRRNGLQVRDTVRGTLPTPEFVYPSLMILAQKTASPAEPDMPRTGDLESFIKDSHATLRHQAEIVSTIIARYERTVFWGCSAQLFSLLPLLDLTQATLCDSSKVKQKSSYRGMPIVAPETVEPKGALIIAPYLHRGAIRRAALAIGWNEADIFSLE